MSTAANEPDAPMTPPAHDPGARRAVAVIASRYEVNLDEPLGSGGMALVYQGRDLRTRRQIALKTLRLEYRNDPETRARFRREARLLAFLAHPNVIRVYDFVEDRDAWWVILEHAEGQPLKEIIAARGQLSPVEVVPILDQVAAALAHLHGRGLVHLDVKPQNILVTDSSSVKLIDFGLAQRSGLVQEAVNGATFGTAAYLSPEQACGDPVDPATDVYALGCVVYELLTGQPPFHQSGTYATKHEVIRARLEQMPAPPTEARPDLSLPAWVDDVVLWALAREAPARYGSVEAFARVFRAGVEGDDLSVGTTTPLALIDVPMGRARLPVSPVPPREAPRPMAVPPPRPVRRSSRRVYRLGGRIARRARPLRRPLWRLAGALAVANVLLGAVLFVSQGRLPGIYEPATILAPGRTASVTEDALRVRAAAGFGAAELTWIAFGTEVEITGSAVTADGEVWWPIEIDGGALAITGYVWEGGLEPEPPPSPADRLTDFIKDLW